MSTHLIGTEEELQHVFRWLRSLNAQPKTTATLLDPTHFEVVKLEGWYLTRPREGLVRVPYLHAFLIDVEAPFASTIPRVAPWLMTAILAKLKP